MRMGNVFLSLHLCIFFLPGNKTDGNAFLSENVQKKKHYFVSKQQSLAMSSDEAIR